MSKINRKPTEIIINYFIIPCIAGMTLPYVAFYSIIMITNKKIYHDIQLERGWEPVIIWMGILYLIGAILSLFIGFALVGNDLRVFGAILLMLNNLTMIIFASLSKETIIGEEP